MRVLAKLISSAAILLAASGGVNAMEYLTNGGFETGDLTGWTLTGVPGFSGVNSNTSGFYQSQARNYHYEAGNLAPNTLSQTFSDTVGTMLTASGWVTGNGTGELQFVFDGVNYTDVVAPTAPYTQYSFNVTATGNDTFGITFSDQPSFFAFDSFSVTSAAVSAVPEPSTWAMMIVGFSGLGFMAYRRRNGMMLAA